MSARPSELFVPINFLGKIISPYPAFLFLNLGIRPDWVTFFSISCIIVSASFFIVGHPVSGVIALLCFFMLDSVDGDMARVVGPSSYGSLLDSFGADFFYALIPASLGYYLFMSDVQSRILPPAVLLISGIFISASFLLYRIINAKLLRFLADRKRMAANIASVTAHHQSGAFARGVVLSLTRGYRHIVIKGNFFSEPGMIMWFSILVFSGNYEILGAYLILVLLYNMLFLGMSLFNTYRIFLIYENLAKNQ